MQLYSKINLITIITTSVLVYSQIQAGCPRCEQIERERAMEQAKNPQPTRYYDENRYTSDSLNPSESTERSNNYNNRNLNSNKMDQGPDAATNRR